MTAIAQFLPGAVAEVGKIKIGTLGPPVSGRNGSYNPMVRLDEFLITTLDRDRSGVLVPDEPLMDSLAPYRDKVGGKLRTIPVMFLSNTIADSLRSRYEWWVGRSKIGASTSDLIDGDGPTDPEKVTVSWYADPATGAVLKEPRTERMTHAHLQMKIGAGDKARPLFSLATTISVMIASNAASFGGVYKFRTKGWHSSNQLLGSLQHIKSITCGILRGPVFHLVVAPRQVFGGGQASIAQVVRVDIRGNDLKQLRDDAVAGVRYELENLRTVRAAEAQFRALGRHEESDDDDEPLALPAASKPGEAADYDLEREDLMERLRQAGASSTSLQGQSLAQLRESAALLPK